MVTNTKFNNTAVLAATTFTFQVGANDSADNQISVTGSAPTFTNAGTIATSAAAITEIAALDVDINAVTSLRATWVAIRTGLRL